MVAKIAQATPTECGREIEQQGNVFAGYIKTYILSVYMYKYRCMWANGKGRKDGFRGMEKGEQTGR